MSLVTKLRQYAGELKVSSLLAQVITVSQGKCLQSMMELQVYLYHPFHSWWTDFVGRGSSRIQQFFNHSFESHLCLPLMYVEVRYTNNSFIFTKETFYFFTQNKESRSV